jgi:hypothetical protein
MKIVKKNDLMFGIIPKDITIEVSLKQKTKKNSKVKLWVKLNLEKSFLSVFSALKKYK